MACGRESGAETGVAARRGMWRQLAACGCYYWQPYCSSCRRDVDHANVCYKRTMPAAYTRGRKENAFTHGRVVVFTPRYCDYAFARRTALTLPRCNDTGGRSLFRGTTSHKARGDAYVHFYAHTARHTHVCVTAVAYTEGVLLTRRRRYVVLFTHIHGGGFVSLWLDNTRRLCAASSFRRGYATAAVVFVCSVLLVRI
jgi:hypothetical protein